MHFLLMIKKMTFRAGINYEQLSGDIVSINENNMNDHVG